MKQNYPKGVDVTVSRRLCQSIFAVLNCSIHKGLHQFSGGCGKVRQKKMPCLSAVFIRVYKTIFMLCQRIQEHEGGYTL